VASPSTEKTGGEGGGPLLERKYRLEREGEGGRQAEKQRERAGVENPPLHLLVIYSFMFSRRLARWLVFWRRRSSAHRPCAILRKTRGGQTQESRKRQHKRKGGALFWLTNFSPLSFLICQDGLLLFFHFFFLEVRDRGKKNTGPVKPSFSLYTELNFSFYQLLIVLAFFLRDFFFLHLSINTGIL